VTAIPRQAPRLLTPAFLAVAAASLAYFIADGITLPVTPLFVSGPLGGNDVAVGVAVGAFSVSALVLRPWVGRVADRRGRRPLLIGGAALFAAGMLGHLLAVSLPILIAMRLILGAAEAMLFVGALTAISDLAPDARRGEAMSLFSLSLYLGVAIGPIIGELVLAESRFGWVWLAAAAMAGVAVFFGLRVPETRGASAPDEVAATELPPTAPDIPVASPSRLRRFIHPAGILPGLVLLASTWGMGGFFAFVPLHAREVGLDGARLVYLLFAGIVIGFRSVAPGIPDRLGARRAAAVALTFDAIGLAVMGVLPTATGLFIGTAIFAFGVAFAFPALSTMAVRAVPASERGAVLGTFSAFLDLAFGIGPITLGPIAEAIGYPGTFIAASVVALSGLALLFVTRARRG
jgi:MFS family permease